MALAKGIRPAPELKEPAKQVALAWKTVETAKLVGGVSALPPETFGGPWRWQLPVPPVSPESPPPDWWRLADLAGVTG